MGCFHLPAHKPLRAAFTLTLHAHKLSAHQSRLDIFRFNYWAWAFCINSPENAWAQQCFWKMSFKTFSIFLMIHPLWKIHLNYWDDHYLVKIWRLFPPSTGQVWLSPPETQLGHYAALQISGWLFLSETLSYLTSPFHISVFLYVPCVSPLYLSLWQSQTFVCLNSKYCFVIPALFSYMEINMISYYHLQCSQCS